MAEELRHRTEDDRDRGLYRKYVALRWPSGQKIDNFFLLRFDQDPFAIPALRAYAAACRERYPRLAADLIEAIGFWEAQQIRSREAEKRIAAMESPMEVNAAELKRDAASPVHEIR